MLAHHVLPGPPDDNLKQVWRGIMAEYKQYDAIARYHTFTPNMIHGNSKTPELKGNVAQIKGLVQVVVAILGSAHGPHKSSA